MTEKREKYGKRTDLEQTFLTRWHQLAPGEPEPVEEYRFHETRRWRFDFAWPTEKVAVECEGGTFVNGGHNRGRGYSKDCEKYNTATVLGWRVFRCTRDMLDEKPGAFMDMVAGALA